MLGEAVGFASLLVTTFRPGLGQFNDFRFQFSSIQKKSIQFSSARMHLRDVKIWLGTCVLTLKYAQLFEITLRKRTHLTNQCVFKPKQWFCTNFWKNCFRKKCDHGHEIQIPTKITGLLNWNVIFNSRKKHQFNSRDFNSIHPTLNSKVGAAVLASKISAVFWGPNN